MIDAERLLALIGSDYYTGVPDSLLRPLCDCLYSRFGTDMTRHCVAANEGNAVALAAGYHLATGRVPVVYMQNSGQGNAVNPLCSLAHPAVYAIPMLLIIGWRGEPGVPDEPQHAWQGQITLPLLETMGIPFFVLSPETAEKELADALQSFRRMLDQGRQCALVIRKGALTWTGKASYTGAGSLTREEALRRVIAASGKDPIVSTTGKASRELFELREKAGQGHSHDFLTVGSMGHASSIALGIALQRPELRVWCVDGDGAALMHLGALATIGASGVRRLTHIVINNSAHESVGGMPTVAGRVNLPAVAAACGYAMTASVSDPEALDEALLLAKQAEGPALVEVRCAIGSRADLGRPTTTPQENKAALMQALRHAASV